jgi:hypothetical protein
VGCGTRETSRGAQPPTAQKGEKSMPTMKFVQTAAPGVAEKVVVTFDA